MSFVKRFGRMDCVPWYYGYVREDLNFNGHLMAIIPLHLLLRAWHLVSLAWIYFKWYGQREDMFRRSQEALRAYRDGRDDGYAEGLAQADAQYQPIVIELQSVKRKLIDAERTLKALQNISNSIK